MFLEMKVSARTKKKSMHASLFWMALTSLIDSHNSALGISSILLVAPSV